jgi:hypothetical protein
MTPAKHVLSDVEGTQSTPVPQILLFPPLSKGDEKGISLRLGVLAR